MSRADLSYWSGLFAADLFKLDGHLLMMGIFRYKENSLREALSKSKHKSLNHSYTTLQGIYLLHNPKHFLPFYIPFLAYP